MTPFRRLQQSDVVVSDGRFSGISVISLSGRRRLLVGAGMRPVWPRLALGFVALCKRRQDHGTYNPPSTPDCGAFLATQTATA